MSRSVDSDGLLHDLARAPDAVRTPSGWALGALVVTWAIVAVIAATTAFIALRGNSIADWFRVLRPMLLYYGVWAALSLLIYYTVETLSGSPARRALAVPVHLGLFLLISLSMPFIAHFESWRVWMYGERAPGFHTLGAFIYMLILVGSVLIRFYRLSVVRDREARDARLRNSLLENQLNLARMDALKMQINPHFLFNALNSIAALIEGRRNVEAYHTTELLGDLLRSALDKSSDRMLPLEQEIEFIRRYVDVEKIRFGSRFSFDVRVDGNCAGCHVPALIIQPLVENAIKHAVGASTGQVQITLDARIDGGDVLKLELCDDGPGLPEPGSENTGYGLTNVRERLALLFGDDATLELRNRPNGGVSVDLRLPAKTG
jgi:sensor histidine kinase YesM